MSTENNSENLYNNSVKILTDLIGFKTISGEDNSALIDYCDEILKQLGATSFRTYDDEKKRVNLFATLKLKIQIIKNLLYFLVILMLFQFRKGGVQILSQLQLEKINYMAEAHAI